MTEVKVNDIVQVDPESEIGKAWGAQLVIVTDVESWGVKGYFLVSEGRAEPAGCAYLRINHGDYERVGTAAWVSQS